ncbi:MAG: EamA family transporter [Patescibacteria group bacterium]
MQNWFLIALIAPILWSFINHIDKYILSKHEEGRGVGALLIFSSLSSIIVLPILAIFYGTLIFDISFIDFSILFTVGLLSASAFYFYLRAMDTEEASIVIPLFQFDAIFGYFLSYFILSESLHLNQILSSIFILVGIISLSIEIDIDNKFKLKKKVLLLVATSSLMFALSGVLFKKLAIVDSFWVSIFWQYVGLTIFGIFILIFHKKFRDDFMLMITAPKIKILSLNIVSEILYIIGALANNFALLIAPVALVFVVNSYQPLFVFIAGVLFTIFLPKFASEKISKKHFLHKLISIIIILIGSYLLYSSSS